MSKSKPKASKTSFREIAGLIADTQNHSRLLDEANGPEAREELDRIRRGRKFALEFGRTPELAARVLGQSPPEVIYEADQGPVIGEIINNDSATIKQEGLTPGQQ